MKPIAALSLFGDQKRHLVLLLGIFTGILFITLLVASVVVVTTIGGSKAHAAGLSCALGTTTVAPGGEMSIAHSGFSDAVGPDDIAGEPIWIFGTNWWQEVARTTNSMDSTQYQAFTVPVMVPEGQYNIVIKTRFPVTSTTCTGGPFTVVTSVQRACSFGPTRVFQGDRISLSTNHFSASYVKVKAVGLDYNNIVNLGTIPAEFGYMIGTRLGN